MNSTKFPLLVNAIWYSLSDVSSLLLFFLLRSHTLKVHHTLLPRFSRVTLSLLIFIYQVDRVISHFPYHILVFIT